MVNIAQRKMNIALICQPWDSFVPPVNSGSIPIWTYEVVRQLHEQCNFIIYSKKKSNLPAEEKIENMICKRVPITVDRFTHKFLHRVPFSMMSAHPFFASRWYHWSYIRSIAKDLRQRECDIVHIMNFSQFIPVIRKWNSKIKIVLNMRCEWLTQLDHHMIDQRLSRTDSIIGVSDYITNQIRQKYPRYENRCSTVVNGVDPDRYLVQNRLSDKNEAIRMLYVGRLSPEKGIHVLLEAFIIVARKCPGARLVIVGPEGAAPIDFIVNISWDEHVRQLATFYEESYLSWLKRQLPADVVERITFTGFVSNDQLYKYYGQADILINPSLSESFGRSLIEAMAAGLPVVASRVGGMPEIIEEGKTGLLVDSNNTEMLAKAILRLAEDYELRRNMGRYGRDRVIEKYSWNRVAASLMENYQRIYAQKPVCDH